jgi:hypothetical protein
MVGLGTPRGGGRDGFVVAEVENEHVAPCRRATFGSLLGITWRDGPMYGGVGARPVVETE